MDAYIYQADMLCEDCAREIKQQIREHYPELVKAEDSGDWPQGPYGNGGGEADCPQHCGNCDTFLENPLTGDGVTYVQDAIDHIVGDVDVLTQWRDYYGIEARP